MRTTLLLIGACVVLLANRSIAGVAEHAIPKRASIIVVPTRYNGYIATTGNVKVTFSDGHTEVWTQSGDCYNVKISPKGRVGWIRIDRKSVEPARMIVVGKDSLVVRSPNGTTKQFPPFGENGHIMDWRFTDDIAVTIRSMGYHGPSSFVRCDLMTGKIVDSRGPNYTPYAELPAWAKPLADPKLD